MSLDSMKFRNVLTKGFQGVGLLIFEIE